MTHHVHAVNATLSRAGLKLAAEMADVRDVENTPAWMHAYNALIDKVQGKTPNNPLYHPSFAQLDAPALWSMVPDREQTMLREFYPQVDQLLVPPAPPTPEIAATPKDQGLLDVAKTAGLVKEAVNPAIAAITSNLDKIDRQKAKGKTKKRLQAGKPTSQPERKYTASELAKAGKK